MPELPDIVLHGVDEVFRGFAASGVQAWDSAEAGG
jgi:hypothetical protein